MQLGDLITMRGEEGGERERREIEGGGGGGGRKGGRVTVYTILHLLFLSIHSIVFRR